MKHEFTLIASALALGTALQAAVPDTFLDAFGTPFEPPAIATAVKTDAAVTIDANADEAIWSTAPQHPIDFVSWPAPAGTPFNGMIEGVPKVEPEDLSGYFQAAWDDQYLYLLYTVTDNIIVINDVGAEYEKNDAVEIYLSGDNNRELGLAWNLPEYDGVNDRQLKIKADGSTPPIGGLYDPQENGTVVVPQDVNIERAFRETATGYIVEIRLDFSGIFRTFAANGSMVQDVEAGTYFGFDAKISDNDDGPGRKITYGWANPTNESYASPGLFGVMVLVEGDDPPPPPVSLWEGVATVQGLKSVGMGWIYDGNYPYVYHYPQGWVYIIPVGSSLNSIWGYQFDGTFWFWTSEDLGNLYFNFSTSSWESWN